jgi:uncharacterized membrane protein
LFLKYTEETKSTADEISETEQKIEKEQIIEEEIYSLYNIKTVSEIPSSESSSYTPKPPRPTFFERHPDLEKFIGENLINKIGIAILVLGISFFVKYAIDKDWINEIGRVCIGLAAGGLLIAIAHRLRKSFHAFSSVLIGGGLSVLYFTIGIAFHEYRIFSQPAAFGIMVIITGFAVMLSIIYNRVELAVLALIGGFTTPFILSTGEGNYKVLFTYLIILNAGMLVLAYRKKWKLVNILSYVFTILIYGSWLSIKCMETENGPYIGAFIFGTIFYLIFFAMNIVYNLRNKIHFAAFEIGMLLSNTFLYYAAGLATLGLIHNGDYQGLFTVTMGIFNFVFAFLFYKKSGVDRNLVYLLIGLVMTFISLAAPIQLEGNYITLFWAAEAVLLLWFFRKTGIRLVKYTSVIVTGLMVISLVMDWIDLYYFTGNLPVVLNKAFITSVVATLSLYVTGAILSKEEGDSKFTGIISYRTYYSIIRALFIIVLYFSFFNELTYQLNKYFDSVHPVTIGQGIYNFLFISAAFVLYRKNPRRSTSIVMLGASSILILFYLMLYNPAIIEIRDIYLHDGVYQNLFSLHFLLATFFAINIYIFSFSFRKLSPNENTMSLIKIISVVLIIYITSAELNHIVNWISYSEGRIISMINRQVSKAGYSVLWGLISLVLMQQGMQKKDRTLRIISLTLFFITIIKLFFHDIKGISESGKIIAFISLGILLLTVSFMYQRLKKLILENENSIKDEG